MPARIGLILIFVRRFDECLKFYRNAFGLKPVRIYRGKGHPRWVEFKAGGLRLALHAGYKGRPYKGVNGGPIVLHFRVKNILETAQKIRRYGGTIKFPPRRVDFRPAELMIAYEGRFADPDGNEFDFQQVLKHFD